MNSSLKNRIVLKRPRVTEKASFVNTQNVYAFEIDAAATKADVAREIEAAYKVRPIRVNITKNPAKKTMHKGKVGQTRALKKAYVYLKSGDKIEI